VITITHSRADGTLVESAEHIPASAVEILKAWPGNFRWFPSVRQYGVRNSRDKQAVTWKLDRVAENLRAAGFEVSIEITEDAPRPFAEVEAERNARATERAERRTELAAKRQAEADAAYKASRYITGSYPMGQPILVGHHSQRRHERDLERAHNLMGKSVQLDKTAAYHAGRAETAAHQQEHRENIPTTLRRIERLEAAERRMVRSLDRATAEEWRSAIAADLTETREELEYWRGHVAAAEAAGVKIWGPADFTKGDFVQISSQGWYEVKRVNPKTIAVVTAPGWHDKTDYTKVRGRMSAEEMAAKRAEAKAKAESEPDEQ
jgi:hypothetical protein